MEQLMWIGIWIVAVIGLLMLIPLLVIGGWFIFVTLIMGLGDRIIVLLDQWWKRIDRSIRTRAKPPLRVEQQNAVQSKLAPASGSTRGLP